MMRAPSRLHATVAWSLGKEKSLVLSTRRCMLAIMS